MRAVIIEKLLGAYRGFVYSAALSVVGLLLQAVFYLGFGSIILLTDIVHWLIDSMVEIFGLVAIYYAIRIGRRFPWGLLGIESATILLSLAIALGIYLVSVANYLLGEYSTGSVTTLSIYPAIATAIGGLLTFSTMVVQRANYKKYSLQVLKVDYIHALIDTVASIASTIGIVVVFFTKNSNIEVFFVIISSMFIVHSLLEMLRDVIRTITGSNIDHSLSIRLYKKLSNLNPRLHVEDVIARRIGSFYIVETKIGLNPSEKMSTIYRLRKKIIDSVLEESDLVYHVDVKFFPLAKGRNEGKASKKH